jgi:anhydro-N-acetylmuramic acid kinase
MKSKAETARGMGMGEDGRIGQGGFGESGLILRLMVYKVIGLMSGSSLDGLDIAYVHLQERAVSPAQGGARQWEYELVHTACHPYPEEWKRRLAEAPELPALEYQLLHAEYGHWLGAEVNRFIEEHNLHYQVQLIASHGHTAFHLPTRKMTAQLGDGAALAAATRINVVGDLRAMDLALGGQGAPIVPVGEKGMLPGYVFFLNLGGIANISKHGAGAANGDFTAFDICPANRVLNMLAERVGKPFDEGGALAAEGRVDEELLKRLNALSYYDMGYPKSLSNDFGTATVFPLIRDLGTRDALRTYVEHIAVQVKRAVELLGPGMELAGPGMKLTGTEGPEIMVAGTASGEVRMLVTGGGAHNGFLIGRIRESLSSTGVVLVVPDAVLVDYKEALMMAFIGVLRWREENNVLASVTGASRDSIGGAVWIGQEA